MNNPKFKENDVVYYVHCTFNCVEIKEIKILYLVDSIYDTMRNGSPVHYCCQETKYSGTYIQMVQIKEEELFLSKMDAHKFAIEILNEGLAKVNKQKEYLELEIVQINEQIKKLCG